MIINVYKREWIIPINAMNHPNWGSFRGSTSIVPLNHSMQTPYTYQSRVEQTYTLQQQRDNCQLVLWYVYGTKGLTVVNTGARDTNLTGHIPFSFVYIKHSVPHHRRFHCGHITWYTWRHRQRKSRQQCPGSPATFKTNYTEQRDHMWHFNAILIFFFFLCKAF